jgi:hypothetical protein
MPTNVFPDTVHVLRRHVVAVSESPYTFSQQVYQFPGQRWEIEVTLQPMDAISAALWTQFFSDLNGRAGTFTLNLTPHCPGLVPAPGVKTFRLAEDPGWDSHLAADFRYSFKATEAL